MLEKLKKLKVGTVLSNVEYKTFTTYRLKGKAKYVVEVTNLDALKRLLIFLKENHVSFKIVGGGSNLIFKDFIYDGVIIKLNHFDSLSICDNQIKVGCGYPFMRLALKCCKLGFTGLEFATGIPGTVGGAIYNNAGAYGSDMGYVLLEATVLTPDLEIKVMKNRQMQFHYRDSFFKHHPGYVILEAKMLLKRGDKEEILSLIQDRKERRIASQPLEYPSAGSVFRNPLNVPAGKLIEDLGLKGYSVGDASVSLKHANFIINKGNASGSDVVLLIDEIKRQVSEKYHIDLILEQEIV
jgi:UDP-N-acetylmuramate dehydrogenase